MDIGKWVSARERGECLKNLDPRIPEWIERQKNGETWHEIGKSVGITGEAIRKRCSVYKKRRRKEIGEQAYQSGEETSMFESMRLAERVVGVEADENNPRIQSILEKAEVPPDEFYVHRAVVNEWGWNRETDEPYFQAKAEIRPVPNADLLKRLRDTALDEFRSVCDVSSVPVRNPEGKYLLEIDTVDLHFGKKVWVEQCHGGEYNTGIAEQRGQAATLRFLERAAPYDVGKIIIPGGHDLLHFDDVKIRTAHGTQMLSDEVYEEVYRRAVKFVRWQIETCAQVAPVEFINCPGNHDATTVFHIAELLAAVYENHPNIAINNSTAPRKYTQWGQTLLGYMHGDHIQKLEELPMTMADEAPNGWANTRFHEWRCGHKHNEFKWMFKSHDQMRTTGIHFLPSLCATDHWHHKNRYHHHPKSEAHLFHAEEGHDTQFTYTAKEVG